MKRLLIFFLTLTIGCFLLNGVYAQDGHFHPKGKQPSKHTLKILEAAKADLPFSDTRDFEEADKGFIAAPKSKKIMADAGHVACVIKGVKA
jgi:alkyl sulfatase BDS1-like metallo-beta-lactamase superfamily hydrolase